MSTDTRDRVEALAQDLFEVVTQVCLSTLRGRRRDSALKEIEFLALSILHAHERRTVGDLQRTLGVLPAQMSRIIRSLEGRPRPLVRCQINPQDKRKVDVYLTSAGRGALLAYQEPRVQRLAELLQTLPDEELDDLVQMLHKLHLLLERNNEVTGTTEGEG